MAPGALVFDLTWHRPMTYMMGTGGKKKQVLCWGHSAHPAEELQVFCSPKAKGEMGPSQGED